MTRRFGIVVALALALPLLPGPASAAARAPAKAPGLVVTPQSWSGRAGVTVAVIVRTAPYTGCEARVAHRSRHDRLTQQPRPLRTSRKRGVGRWQWNVARGVPAGTWLIRVRCWTRGGMLRRTATLRTAGGPPARHVPHHLFAPGSLIVSHDTLGSGGAGNPYPRGECTWWAWQERPDLPFFPGLGGDALNWAASAVRQHIPIGRRPVVGAIAVIPPYRDGAGYLGHVAYVEEVSGPDITVSEAGFEHTAPGHRRSLAWRGLMFIYGGSAGDGRGNATQKPIQTHLTPGPGIYIHHVYHTCFNGHCGLARRTGPGYTGYQTLEVIPDGTEVGITCQTTGERVSGIDGSSSNVWDELTDGSFVADYYVDTPGTLGAFSPPIPRCTGPNPAPDPSPPPYYVFHVTGTCADGGGCVLKERSGPGFSSFPVVGTLAEGAEADVSCQATGESVGTTATYFTVVWDRLANGDYVSDYYLDTRGGDGGFTDPIPRC